jgi:SAM-dependent methyltransferase
MDKTAIRACPICKNRASELLHTQEFALSEGHPLAKGYDVVACELCGFVYADTDTPQGAYDNFYACCSKYSDSKTSTGGGESVWDAERLTNTAATISAFLDRPDKTILDVGCANGGLLEALKTFGHRNVTGVDPARTCVANSRKSGLCAYLGSLSALPASFKKFDVVILSHVLEHIQDLRTALKHLRQILHEDSVVYVEVPDASRYCDFVKAPFQDFNTEHINHFSGICLNNLAQQFGLSPVVLCTEKVVKASLDTLYPAIYSIYKYTANATTGGAKDFLLRDRISDYIAISSNLMKSLNARLLKSLEDCPEVILWGSGQLAMKLLNEAALRTTKIVACIDGNPINHGNNLGGIPILAPRDVKNLSRVPIVITTTLHESEIRSDIRQLGVENRLISLKEPHHLDESIHDQAR